MIDLRIYANTLLASMAAAQTDPRSYRRVGDKIVESLIDPTLPPEPPDDPRTNDDLDEGEDDED